MKIIKEPFYYTDQGTAEEIEKNLKENEKWEKEHPHIPSEMEWIETSVLRIGISRVISYLEKIGYKIIRP